MVVRGVCLLIHKFIGFLVLSGLLLAFLVTDPSMAADREKLPSDSGIVAYLDGSWSSFPRVDGLGDIGISRFNQMAYDAPRRRLLIADYHNDRLLVLNQQGKVEAVLANSTRATVPAPWLKDCHDVAVDSRGRVFMVDTRNETVWILDPDLSWVGAVPVPLVPDGFPWCVAVDSMDRVLVGQYRFFGNSRILVYQEDDNSGSMELVTSFKFNPPDEQAYCGWPLDIVVDSQDRIIVAEGSTTYYAAQRVHVFDKEFRWVNSMGSDGSEPGQFVGIASLAIGPGDTIIVSDPTHWSTVSFFFKNGTYAGRIGGHQQVDLEHPTGLLVRSETLLVGGSKGLKEINVEWTSLHPTETSTTPPGPEPVPEYTALAALVLLSWGLAMRSIQAISQRRVCR